MAKAVCLMSPYHGGHIYATLEMIRELVNRGEQVVYFFREPYRSKIESTGADFRDMGIAVDESAETGEDFDSRFGIEALFYHARDTLYESKKVYQQMLDKVRAERPDYIIHDSGALWSKQIAKHLRIPAVCTVASFAYCDGMIEAAPDLLQKYVLRMSDAELPGGNKNGLRIIINALAQNLQRSYDIEDLMDVFLAKEKLNLVFTSAYFHIVSEIFDNSFKFVGPSFQPQEATLDLPEEFFNTEPLIYIYLRPEFADFHNFYRTCLAAFGDSGYRVVLSLKHKAVIAEPGAIPRNIQIVYDSSPGRELMKKAAVMITNEGFDVVYEALYYETPLITIPYAADQSLLGNRVEELGAGIFLKQAKTGESELREATGRILGDASYRRNCRQISQSFKAAGGATKAVDEVFIFKQENNIG